jgi:hypothetical protein
VETVSVSRNRICEQNAMSPYMLFDGLSIVSKISRGGVFDYQVAPLQYAHTGEHLGQGIAAGSAVDAAMEYHSHV